MPPSNIRPAAEARPAPARAAHEAAHTAPARALPYALAAAAATVAWGALLLWLGWRRYLGFNAGMLDLGNMAQAVASLLRGQPLVFSFLDGPFSRLALHVELFYALLGPVWALWPDPRALLTVQAALYAAGAIPAFRLGARAAAHPLGGLCLVLIYLLYPVAQTAVLFDFHGDTLAMPLLLFALDALDRRAWLPYALWIALALSCKFYVAAPVAALGFVLWLRPETRRAGLATGATAVLYGLLAFFVIRPLFTTETTASVHAGGNYISYYFGALDELAATLPQRLLSAVVVFGPALLLAWGGRRWLVPALPLALAALVSTGPGGSYDYRYHHYAVVVPFVIMAAAEGIRRARERAEAGRPGRRWRPDAIFTALVVAVVAVPLVDTPLNPLFWLGVPGRGLDHAVYGITPRDAVKTAFLAREVPPGAPLAASNFLAPHLVERDRLYLVRYHDDPGGQRLPSILPRVSYVLADALFDWRVVADGVVVGGVAYEQREIGMLLRDPAFGLVAARDGLLLFQRDPPPGAALEQQVETVSSVALPPLEADLGPARLLGAAITPLGGRRFAASFEWQLTGPPPAGPWVAVSRIGGRDDARIVHLPTFATLPIGAWRPGQIVRERFEFVVPDDLPPGSYPWTVAWYDASLPEAAFADGRSLPPGAAPALVREVTIP
jgi:uncharacterized membrane protein